LHGDDRVKKRLLILLTAVIVLLGSIFYFVSGANQKSVHAEVNHNCGTHDTVIEMLLYSEIEKKVESFYKPYFNSPPEIDPVSMNIQDIIRAPAGYDVTLQLYPYLGAHNSVGEDIITINVIADSITTKEFKHVKSYEVPNWLQQYVIKWPP
jgi:hypothetical protein